MVIEWLLYAGASSAVVALGGLAAERALQLFSLPQRWAWVAAIAASLVVPLVLPRVRESGPEPSAAVASLPVLPAPGPAAPVLHAAPGAEPGRLADAATLAGWLFASLAGMGWLALSAVSLRRARRQWVRTTVDGAPVLVSRDTGPAVVGWLRGDVVLPAWVMDWDEPRRRMIVAHEREHVRARDPLLLMAGWLSIALVPWNPPLWWQVRRLRLAVEVDCDRRVLRDARDVRAYGTLLLEVGRRTERAWIPSAAFSEPRRTLERRLRMITWKRPPNRGRHAAAAVAATALVPAALFALPAADRPSLEPVAALLASLQAAQEPAVLWITAGDEYRIGRADGPGVRAEELDRALVAMRTGDPGSGALVVRSDSARVAEPGMGYSAIMVGNAACRAGFATVRYELVTRDAGSEEPRRVGVSERRLAPPCEGSGTADTLPRARPATAPGRGAPPAALRAAAAPAAAAGAGQQDTIPEDSIVVAFGRLDRLPDMLNRAATLALVNRIYPQELRDAGISGRVLTSFDVRADGSVDTATIEIVSASHDALRAPSREVAAQFRFRPGEYHGRAVRTQVHVPITWEASSIPAAPDDPVAPAAAPSANVQGGTLRIRGYDIPAIGPAMITQPVEVSSPGAPPADLRRVPVARPSEAVPLEVRIPAG